MIYLCPFDFKGTDSFFFAFCFLKPRNIKSISINVESVTKRGQFCHASPSAQICKKISIAVRV